MTDARMPGGSARSRGAIGCTRVVGSASRTTSPSERRPEGSSRMIGAASIVGVGTRPRTSCSGTARGTVRRRCGSRLVAAPRRAGNLTIAVGTAPRLRLSRPPLQGVARSVARPNGWVDTAVLMSIMTTRRVKCAGCCAANAMVPSGSSGMMSTVSELLSRIWNHLRASTTRSGHGSVTQ